MKKKLFALVMTLALIFTSFIPVTSVFAEGEATTAPKVTLNSAKASFPGITASWGKVDCENYEIQIALNTTFTSSAQKWWPTKDKTSMKLMNKKILSGKKYYVRIRAKKGGKYGPWSNVKEVTPKTTGLDGKSVIKNKYYKNACLHTGDGWVNDEKYYFVKGELKGNRKLMWQGAQNAKSKTKYLVMTDCKKNITFIYTGKKGAWKVYKFFDCTTGADDTPTPKVNRYKPGGNMLKFSGYNDTRGRKPYTCWFASRFQGSCFYHSVLYWRDSAPRKIMSGGLGVSRSHGCIRLSLKNAIWMYKNIKKGTRIITFNKKIPKAKG